MSDEQLEQVKELGILGFPISSVAQLLELPEKEVNQQFVNKSGELYTAYTSGRIQGLVDVRRTIRKSAINASSPALEKMIDFFKQSEYENMEIWDD